MDVLVVYSDIYILLGMRIAPSSTSSQLIELGMVNGAQYRHEEQCN